MSSHGIRCAGQMGRNDFNFLCKLLIEKLWKIWIYWGIIEMNSLWKGSMCFTYFCYNGTLQFAVTSPEEGHYDKPLRAHCQSFCFLGPIYLQRLTGVKARISNYMQSLVFSWDVYSHPCPNFNGSLAKLLLKLGHGWVITPIFSHGCGYLFMPKYLTAHFVFFQLVYGHMSPFIVVYCCVVNLGVSQEILHCDFIGLNGRWVSLPGI